MKIQSMFRDDINRKINGVVQVEQDKNDVIFQEIREYVITSELRKHFSKFFSAYSDSFDSPTDNVGVWITGFFGSGKSHFLKMLSYLLSNKEINGVPTIEYFREKFDNELEFMNVVRSTSVPTETILFNIDVESAGPKDDTAVLRVFATVFYNHLGFYGKDLKVVKLEQFITRQNKMDEFKRVFEKKNGESWVETRNNMVFFEDDVVETLQEVLGMSETAAQHWFDGEESSDISISQLVDDIKEYVDSKPEGFRLLFMVDEVGQYIGTNTSMLLNLQSLIEKLGSVCRGQVWVVATGQEALDEIIKVRTDEFSRIMARFDVRLSLSSSSVGEVIEKRLLTKTDEAKDVLSFVYDNNASVLRNLYSFDTEVKDLKGFGSEQQFVDDFPFVPYQFVIMQKVFNEIRKHGHAGKHQSNGERSMLNGFQESAQRMQDRNELTLVPLYEFYDTLHSFLDTPIKAVVERADRAARDGNGLTLEDVSLLKTLYLIRYIDDIPSNVENLTILMANSIDVDKLALRDVVQTSLDRLVRQNYVSRNGEVYLFLTDEEQDVAREISNQVINIADVIEEIKKSIFEDIYDSKKFKFQNNLFGFEGFVDDSKMNNLNGEMSLRFVTNACDENDRRPERLLLDSKDCVICLMSDSYPYFDKLEQVLKTKKYTRQINRSQLPDSTQSIIQARMNESNRLSREVREDIEKSIVEGEFFIDGEKVSISGSSAKNKLNDALERLVGRIYSELHRVEVPVKDDSDVVRILRGNAQGGLDGCEYNQDAYSAVLDYLNWNASKKLSIALVDIYKRFESAPYGWQRLDIMAIVARLLVDGEIDVKNAGRKLLPSDSLTFNCLKNSSDIGKTSINKHEKNNERDLRIVRSFLKEFADTMDVPVKEDDLIQKIVDEFNEKLSELSRFNQFYREHNYPGQNVVKESEDLMNEVLFLKNDNIAFVKGLAKVSDDLLDNNEELKDVENFFENQVSLYNSGLELIDMIRDEVDYFVNNDVVNNAIASIKKITNVSNSYNYSKIKDLNGLIATVKDERSKVLKAKKLEIKDFIEQCLMDLESYSCNNVKLESIMTKARTDFKDKKVQIDASDSLLYLGSRMQILSSSKDSYIKQMDDMLCLHVDTPSTSKPKPKAKRVYYKNAIFQSKHLSSKEDVDDYVEMMRNKLMSLLNDGEEIDLQ